MNTTEQGLTETTFKPTEIAYYVRGSGKGWVRKVCKTQRALDRLLEKLEVDGAEILSRDAEV